MRGRAKGLVLYEARFDNTDLRVEMISSRDVGIVGDGRDRFQFALHLIAVDGLHRIVVQQDTTGCRDERTVGKVRVVEPGAVAIVIRAFGTTAVQLKSGNREHHTQGHQRFINHCNRRQTTA